MGGLLALLSEYNHLHAMQLGDFVPAPRLNATHWKRPFACGGAGTVLSRAAVLRTNWAACVYAFSGTCLQSDWMIGRCLEASRVTAVIGSGCGTCAMPKVVSPGPNMAEAFEPSPSLKGCALCLILPPRGLICFGACPQSKSRLASHPTFGAPGTCVARPGFSSTPLATALRERLRSRACALAQLPRTPHPSRPHTIRPSDPHAECMAE